MNRNAKPLTWAPLLLIGAMSVLFYYPVLFQHQSQIHAEGVSLGVALMHMLSTALHGDASMLWTTSIYGGHPIFAEGQGGFANPLHLLLAWLLPPVPAYNIHQFLSMLLSGIGAYGMCRSFGRGRAAACFAALALVYSTLWIGGRSNLAIGSTIGWIPWVVWGMQVWLRRADLAAAAFFGAAVALMVLSGYPQLVHGALIYMACYIGVQLLYTQQRLALWDRRGPLLGTLLVAVLVAVGLSAVQWLPLVELAGQSHRSEGVSIVPLDNVPIEAFLRGFLYTFSDPAFSPARSGYLGAVYFTVMGSVFVCVVFSLLVFLRRTPQIIGHLIATALLFVLGFGMGGTPLFGLLYDWHLVPGLHSFRVSFTYLNVALVGFVLVCAYTLDGLARLRVSGETVRARWRSLTGGARGVLLLACWAAIWLLALFMLHVPGVPLQQYLVAPAWVLASGVAISLGAQRVLPILALALLCVDIGAFRVDAYRFGDASLIARPRSIQALESQADLRDFKFYDITYFAAYSFLHPRSPEVVAGLSTMLASVTPASNALWGVSSLRGNFALDLKRRRLADAVIAVELGRGNTRTPGLRLIDFVSMKYLVAGPQFSQPGFIEAYTDPVLPVRILENVHARPRFQFFDKAVFVASVEQAIDTLEELQQRTLVVEGTAPGAWSGVAGPVQGEAVLKLVRDTPAAYTFEISTPSPVWFFMADANYPGWNAYLDAGQVPVYSAQVLGKAVLVPAGDHMLELAFEPASVRYGLGITMLTGAALLLLAVRGAVGRKSPARPRR